MSKSKFEVLKQYIHDLSIEELNELQSIITFILEKNSRLVISDEELQFLFNLFKRE